MLVVLAMIISGLAGVVIVVIGVDAGVLAGGSVCSLEQPASNTNAITITKILLNESSLFNSCFNAIIPSFKFFEKVTPNKKAPQGGALPDVNVVIIGAPFQIRGA